MSNRKINIVIRLQHWMDSVPGQTFLNYAYSWGAAIVILGTLFKLTHLPGANLMLFMGMGTEVVVFFLSAFDRPFDKGEQGKELPDDYETDEEIAARLNLTDDEEDSDEAEMANNGANVGGTIIIGGVSGASAIGGQAAMSGAADSMPYGANPLSDTANSIASNIDAATIASAANAASSKILEQAASSLAPDMQEAAQAYVDKLKSLTETLAKVEEQSSRLTTDSEEMSNLNRTLTGINTVYELQLKSISMQVGTIDQINEQTRRMAKQIEELNGVYGRMIKALTVNMKNAAGAANVE